ncbi:MAG: glycosyltransferase family 39 protein [Chitinophagales bacterium]
MKNNIAENYWYYICIAGLALVYALGLQIDVMDIDAAQYASIAREMAENGNYLQVQHRLKDYLDKPPLLFWLSSLSFQIFGISNWAYKLPSFLSTLIGIFALYRFAALFYSKDTAKLSALIYASCQALILINNDVRTDTLLTNAVIFSIWQLAAFMKNPKAVFFIGSAVGIALGLLAKGPLGLMIPALAFGTHFLLRGEWKQFFRPAWYGIILLSLLMISPMIWGLYEQYGNYGPYFFFWEQSFGRLTGENAFIQSQAVRQDPSPLFFTHTFLWSFLPFSLFAVFGVFRKILNLIVFRQKNSGNREQIALGGFVLTFIAMSMSQYKLPHYIYPAYPLAAVLTARFILLMTEKQRPYWQYFIRYFQLFVTISLLGIAVWMGTQWFGVAQLIIWILFAVFALLSILAFFNVHKKISVVMPSVLAIIAANFIVNGFFYPQLLKYQGTKELANYIEQKQISIDNVYTYKSNFHSLDFYSQSIVQAIYSKERISSWNKTAYLIVPNDEMHEIEDSGISYEEMENFYYYPVTLITGKFLSPETRDQKLRKLNLIKIN